MLFSAGHRLAFWRYLSDPLEIHGIYGEHRYGTGLPLNQVVNGG